MDRNFNSVEDVLAGLREANEKALKYLYREHYPMIRNLILSNSGTENDAQDILQEGIIAFYEKVKDRNFKLTCEIKTYLYAVCRNKWLKILRKRNTHAYLNEVYQQVIDVEQCDDETNLTLQQKIIVEFFEKIGDNCKKILTYFYYDKLTMEEIAGKMGYTNAENAKNQKYKCLKRLQKMALVKYNRLTTING